MKINALLALVGFAAAADYNTVLADVYNIGALTNTLAKSIQALQPSFTGTGSQLQVQVDSVAIHKKLLATINDVIASSAFGTDGSNKVYTALSGLSGTVVNTLSSISNKTAIFDQLAPIVRASLEQLKQDTDQFSYLLSTKFDPQVSVQALSLLTAIDNAYNSAIRAYGGNPDNQFAATLPTSVSLPFKRQAAANKTAVSTDVFNKIVRYTTYCAAAYEDNCSTPPFSSTVVKYFNDNATDAQATLFRNDFAQEIVLAFRGTSTPQDFQADIAFGLAPLTVPGTNCSACQVHSGFQNQYNSLASAVLTAVKSQVSSHASYKFIITGHSLGGGLASLSAVHHASNGVKVSSVYTYGEPRNGNPAYTPYIEKLVDPSIYFRVTHADDGVPHIPPAFFGYSHHGIEYWQSAPANQTNSASTTYKCSGGPEPQQCNAALTYGDNAIDGAHISYSNQLIGNSLRIVQCGAMAIY